MLIPQSSQMHYTRNKLAKMSSWEDVFLAYGLFERVREGSRESHGRVKVIGEVANWSCCSFCLGSFGGTMSLQDVSYMKF
jgi:hypothetical protein